MRIILFTHSLVSDWNHGNAHFQRGVLSALQARGHETLALEPKTGWSRTRLIAEQGMAAVKRFGWDFPELKTRTYDGLDDALPSLDGADIVIVHEWTDPYIANRLGRMRAAGAPWLLLFHDTHHRMISAPDEMQAFELDGYDAVLAFGEALAEAYRQRGWGRRVQVWHEAADIARFVPRPGIARTDDLVWIGNWGDGERAIELAEFLVEPCRALQLAANAYGVRYPEPVRQMLRDAGIHYRGWVSNAAVPEVFARHRVTLHVPRRQYVRDLPGIPTIRMFEALACGIPLVAANWRDSEGLFREGHDYLPAPSGAAMQAQIRRVLSDADLAAELARSGLETIRARHTCAHRVDELLTFVERLDPDRIPTERELVS